MQNRQRLLTMRTPDGQSNSLVQVQAQALTRKVGVFVVYPFSRFVHIIGLLWVNFAILFT